MPEQQKAQESPFSPLQTGCAVVMLSNMLIYLGVVAFVFNLLDPSRLDASYIARRGFASREEREDPEDTSFRRIAEERREDQLRVQREIADTSRRAGMESPSKAGELSELRARTHASSMPEQPELPSAALTLSASRRSGTYAGMRGRYSTAIFSQNALGGFSSPFRLYTLRLIAPEQYQTLPVQIAQQIRFPTFGLPEKELQDIVLYDIPDPIPDPIHGEPRFTAPSRGAEMYYTNYLRQSSSKTAGPAEEPKE